MVEVATFFDVPKNVTNLNLCSDFWLASSIINFKESDQLIHKKQSLPECRNSRRRNYGSSFFKDCWVKALRTPFAEAAFCSIKEKHIVQQFLFSFLFFGNPVKYDWENIWVTTAQKIP